MPLSLALSIYLSIYLYLSISIYIYLSISIYLSIYLSIYVCVYHRFDLFRLEWRIDCIDQRMDGGIGRQRAGRQAGFPHGLESERP